MLIGLKLFVNNINTKIILLLKDKNDLELQHKISELQVDKIAKLELKVTFLILS